MVVYGNIHGIRTTTLRLAVLELFLDCYALVVVSNLVAEALRVLIVEHDTFKAFDQNFVGDRPLRLAINQPRELGALKIANQLFECLFSFFVFLRHRVAS